MDPYTVGSSEVLRFLTFQFNKGLSAGSLNSIRLAISFISNQDLGNDPLIKRFFKGVFRARPLKAKYDVIYDIDPLLKKIISSYTLKDLGLSLLSEKLVILLALGTAQRVQTISLFKLSNIEKTGDGYRVKISDFIKTSRPGNALPIINLPCIPNNLELCIACTLTKYLEVTVDLRGDCDTLLITTRAPHHAASRQTISRWIRAVLTKCGVSKEYTAHSTRHASTSAALKKGIDINLIKKVVGWSPESLTFCKFYNRPLETGRAEFMSTVFS